VKPALEPYGYVIPRGKCLVVTDLSTIRPSTNRLPPGSFELAANSQIGGIVTMTTGFAVALFRAGRLFAEARTNY
jgi:hypothetical protein